MIFWLICPKFFYAYPFSKINFLKGKYGFGPCYSWLRCFQFFFSFSGLKENFFITHVGFVSCSVSNFMALKAIDFGYSVLDI